MKSKNLLIILGVLLFGSGISFSAFGQQTGLSGVWDLKGTKIEQVNQDKSKTEISNIEQTDLFVFGIFDQLTFEEDLCHLKLDEQTFSTNIENKVKVKTFKINMGSAAFLYNYSFNAQKELVLRHTLSNPGGFENADYEITLTYKKQ